MRPTRAMRLAVAALAGAVAAGCAGGAGGTGTAQPSSTAPTPQPATSSTGARPSTHPGQHHTGQGTHAAERHTHRAQHGNHPAGNQRSGSTHSSDVVRAKLLPGMPAPLSPSDVYAADRPGMLSPAARRARSRVYVPNSGSNTVSIINPHTYRVVRTVHVGIEPQHVVPSWDLRTLWVNNDLGNSLTPINPRTGRFGRRVRVADPYNLYFTPNGKYAIVMASALRRLVFRDPHTMRVRKSLKVPCSGVNHADFTADGRFFLVSCEFSRELLEVDTARMRVVKVIHLRGHMMAKPQDVKLSPDGRVFYVADMMRNGVFVVDARRFRVVGFIHTGKGAHGLYITRDSKRLLVTNRDAGTIAVLNLRTRRVIDRWRIPGGSPDMGGLSADGKVFWVSGRYDSEVYAISTRTGHLIRRIPVGVGPHGLCVFPQPGRYSLGHTGVFR
jgi:YVTN family beta-propeller protein